MPDLKARILAAVATELEEIEVALAANLNSGCHVLPALYGTIVYFPSGLMVKWFHDLFAGESDDDQSLYQHLESRAPAGPGVTSLATDILRSVGICSDWRK